LFLSVFPVFEQLRGLSPSLYTCNQTVSLKAPLRLFPHLSSLPPRVAPFFFRCEYSFPRGTFSTSPWLSLLIFPFRRGRPSEFAELTFFFPKTSFPLFPPGLAFFFLFFLESRNGPLPHISCVFFPSSLPSCSVFSFFSGRDFILPPLFFSRNASVKSGFFWSRDRRPIFLVSSFFCISFLGVAAVPPFFPLENWDP